MTIDTMTTPAHRKLSSAETAKVISVLTDAFADDPVIRWMYSGDETYRSAFPRFLRAFGGPAFDEGTVFLERDRRAGAMWIAPGSAPDDLAIQQCLLDTVAEDRQGDLFEVFGAMEAAHPRFQHWYLPWFGTDAAWQSQGVGGSFLERCLEFVDASHLPAYLETPNPRNIPFYERHGFRVIGQAQHGDCPPVGFMLREAR